MNRILQIVSSMNVGGLETFIMNIYRNLDRDKVQFDFLVHTDKECFYNEEIRKLGGKIYSIPARNKGIIQNRNALDSFFEKHKDYTVVHQHVSSLSYIEPLIAARKHNIPCRVIHGHSTKAPGSFVHKYFHRCNQMRIREVASNYFACSENVAEWLYGKSKVSRIDYQIINNGIQTDKFIFNEKIRNEIRKELKIEDMLVLGHVGRFAYPKNHDFLIDIFKSVHEIQNNSVLLLIGDGELKTQIKKKVDLLGLESNVIFLGTRSDVAHLLQAMDVFVFPSHYEGLPLTLVEAQAADLLCFISDRITEKVVITNSVVLKSLSDAPKSWAKRIIEEPKRKRSDRSKNIINAGYDAHEIAIDLIRFYQNQ